MTNHSGELEGRKARPRASDAGADGGVEYQSAEDAAAAASEAQLPAEIRAEFHSGPLPAPVQLAQYDQVVPGLAREYWELVKEEAKAGRERHRRHDNRQDRAQIFSFLLTLAFLAAAGWIAYLGHPWPGSLLAGTTVVSLVALFIRGDRGRRPAVQDTDEQDD